VEEDGVVVRLSHARSLPSALDEQHRMSEDGVG
jgi:hypothetical protein